MRPEHEENETPVASTCGLLVDIDRLLLNAHSRQSSVLKINRSPNVQPFEPAEAEPAPMIDEMLPV